MSIPDLLAEANRLVQNVEQSAERAPTPAARSALRLAEALARSLCDELDRACMPPSRPSPVR